MKRELIAIVLTLSVLIMLTSCSETTTEPVTDPDPPQRLPAPVFEPPSGTYSTSQEVSISCEVEGATIRYIILDSPDDEGKVTELSPGYEEPLLVSQSQLIKAKAFKEGWLPSEVSTGTYTVTETIITVGSFTLTVAPETIYADNGMSYATVKAEVKDEDDFPIVGFPVKFKCSPTGRIASDILTDHFGVATVNYYDTGVESDNVIITARIADEERTVSVEVLPAPEVYGISFGPIPVTVSLNGVYTVTATAYSAPNEPLIRGYPMVFRTDKGGFFSGNESYFDYEAIAYTDDRGRASVRWNSGYMSGDATIYAAIAGSDVTDSVEVYISPGPPENVRLSAIYKMSGENYWHLYSYGKPLDIYGNYESIRILAEITDRYGNHVESGIPIGVFQTDIGIIDPIAPTMNFSINVKHHDSEEIFVDDYKGCARANYFLPQTPGIANISVGDETLRLSIISREIGSLHFPGFEDGPVYLDPRGSGGVESRRIAVELRDDFGNIVYRTDPQEISPVVDFSIIGTAPEGVNLNDQGLSASVNSEWGVATVTVNSGTEPGVIRLRARLADNHNIETVESIVIRSGPPSRIDLFAEGANRGKAVEAGMWKIRVGAQVTDAQGNGVSPATLVNFSLAEGFPEGTTIENAALVGGHEDDEYSGSGIALVWLYYHGNSTNIPVTVRAATGDVVNEMAFILPLQFPELDLSASVEQVRFFSAAGWPQAHYVEVVATVNDGQGNLIAGQEVELTSSQGDGIHHGLAYGDFQGNRPNTVITHIGGVNYQRLHPIAPGMPLGPPQDWPDGDKRPPHTTISERGRAYGIVAAYGNELPPPDIEEWFTKVDNQMFARIIGTHAIAQTSFTMIRYHHSAPPFK